MSRLAALLEENAPALAEAFYDALLADADARALLSPAVVEERLKPSLARWLVELFSPTILADPAVFADKQRKIGEVHARIKVPMHLVMAGASVLQRRLADILRSSEGPWEDRFDDLQRVYDRIDHAMTLMSRSYVKGVESRARQDEAYRLFSLDQDIGLERESQRAELMDWAQTTLFQILDPLGGNDLRRLAESPFGLWIRHRAGVMFEHSPALATIVQSTERIDSELLPRVIGAGLDDRTAALKQLRAAVDEIAFLLGEMFQGLTDMEGGRDPLTRALNRRFLPSILAREISFANKQGSGLSILMVDIDHFKQINDRHGHQAGDVILRQVVDVLAGTMRSSDYLFRYGGEEFLIVLVEVDMEETLRVAERIRQAVEARDLKVGDRTMRVTASIGIALNAGHPDPEFLIRLADGALYRAKQAGRNRVQAA